MHAPTKKKSARFFEIINRTKCARRSSATSFKVSPSKQKAAILHFHAQSDMMRYTQTQHHVTNAAWEGQPSPALQLPGKIRHGKNMGGGGRRSASKANNRDECAQPRNTERDRTRKCVRQKKGAHRLLSPASIPDSHWYRWRSDRSTYYCQCQTGRTSTSLKPKKQASLNLPTHRKIKNKNKGYYKQQTHSYSFD